LSKQKFIIPAHDSVFGSPRPFALTGGRDRITLSIAWCKPDDIKKEQSPRNRAGGSWSAFFLASDNQEDVMSKIFKSIGMSAAFVVAGFLSGEAGAMPLGGPGKAGLDRIDLTVPAAYVWGGKEYCWYDDGWNGPGWYVCGQYTVRGVGWGGGAGWHGWSRTGGRGGTARRGTGGRDVSGRTGGTRTGGARTGGSRTGSARTGSTRSGAGGGRTGGSRTGGGRTGGGRTGGGGRGGGGRGGGGRHSDVLLKHDIALLGRLDNGLGFYRFSYNGSDKA
jgi:hypothetical protein